MTKVTKMLSAETNGYIELVHLIPNYETASGNFRRKDFALKMVDASSTLATIYDNVSLISKGVPGGYDVIAMWDDGDTEENVAVYLGFWNGGVLKDNG